MVLVSACPRTAQGVALATGVLAGLVGVGGGLVLSPFFLITGMEPAMAVGTSATCVLFTSCSTTIQYVFTDRIIMSLAVVYGFVALAASYVGTRNGLAWQHHDKCVRLGVLVVVVRLVCLYLTQIVFQ